MKLQFSIIIPAKNEEANIGRCLDSIAQMDWDKSGYEVIVVDNGSTDRTVDIAKSGGAIVYVLPGLTISGLRNYGAQHASGEILAFLDADCTVGRSWLKQASPYLERRDVACFGSPPAVPDDATWVQSIWFRVRKRHSGLCETGWLESMNMFVRRDLFSASGGFDEKLVTCEDYDLSMRLKRYGSIICDTSIKAVHHGEAATVSNFFCKELWRGKSNFTGMLRHGLSFSEIPSLVAPSFHCLLWIFSVLSPLAGSTRQATIVLTVFLLWQAVLLVVCVRKLLPDVSFVSLFQLHFLLNIYLVARGAGVFSSGRRTGAVQCVA